MLLFSRIVYESRLFFMRNGIDAATRTRLGRYPFLFLEKAGTIDLYLVFKLYRMHHYKDRKNERLLIKYLLVYH